MKITWREGVTTIAAVGAVVVERAYFHNWDWPLVSSTRWVIVGLAVLIAAQYIFSFLLEKTRSDGWFFVANLLAMVAVVLTGLGLLFPASDYVVLLMVTAITYWVADILSHIPVHTSAPQAHT